LQTGLEDCIPKNKHDKASLGKARLVGFPGINVILPQLLEWLQDRNWPVAYEVLDLLSNADEEIVPHIRAVLGSNDGGWKYSLIAIGLISKLSPNIRKSLRADLQRLVDHPTENDVREEVDLISREILDDWNTVVMNSTNGSNLDGIDFDWFAIDVSGNAAVFATAGSGKIPVKVLESQIEHENLSNEMDTPNWGNDAVWDDYAKLGLYVFDWASDSYQKIRSPNGTLSQNLRNKLNDRNILPRLAVDFSHVKSVKEVDLEGI
jgi:hypothetical protein